MGDPTMSDATEKHKNIPNPVCVRPCVLKRTSFIFSESSQQIKNNRDDSKDETLVQYCLKTLWLFTFSDFKTIVVPSTAFAILTAVSGPSLTTNSSVPSLSDLYPRLPLVLSWTWLTLLLVDIANQRHPGSVLEDSLNKPWRPLPSGRISTFGARRLLLIAIPSVLAITKFFLPQGLPVTIIAIIGSYMYNDLGGADESFLVRNLMNAAAITCFGAGAAQVAIGEQVALNVDAYRWLAIIAAIVTTTIQVQDMEDQEGDRARGRVTIPLFLGDVTARHSIALLVSAWSFVCPAYWGLNALGYVLPGAVGLTIAGRTLTMRNVQADKDNWRAWNIWMMTLYLLPVWEDIFSTVASGVRNWC
ncbi:hypothetical protein HO173_011668 [Letharia columbiana]|uniref:Uncharacterized protein n=1 Tax=Letharia columbiana TaxID=112416 RepID=A0A8H6CSJ8_9LECA|nr:uncharacterized protein HO173_011668 [Letharia columbiana]KAF6228820.1 hypothetical protein HO173_011668 [Letharia columbiana]